MMRSLFLALVMAYRAEACSGNTTDCDNECEDKYRKCADGANETITMTCKSIEDSCKDGCKD